MSKIICIVQARMGSERLPGKVIKNIMGKPMIIYTLDRLKKSKYIDKIVVATSILEGEKDLIDICDHYCYEVFRGSEDNVLKRYKEACDKYKESEEDVIIRVTGDCPLIDPLIIDNVITKFLYCEYDYVRLDVPDTFIRGFDVEVFSLKALNKVYSEVHKNTNNTYEDNMYREHVTLYMYRNPEKFKIGYVKGSEFYQKSYRLCVDTKEDFNLVNEIYNNFQDEFVSARQVVDFLDNNKKMSSLNADIRQKEV